MKYKLAALLAVVIGVLTSGQNTLAQTTPSLNLNQNYIIAGSSKVRPGEISSRRINIAGVSLESKMPEVIKLLGKPKQQKVAKGFPAIDGDFVDLFYPGLQVRLVTSKPGKLQTGIVYEVISTSSKHTTIDGICVGDTIDKVIQKYGTPEENVVEGKKYISYWRKPYGTGGLIFEVKNNVVKQISFRFDPF